MNIMCLGRKKNSQVSFMYSVLFPIYNKLGAFQHQQFAWRTGMSPAEKETRLSVFRNVIQLWIDCQKTFVGRGVLVFVGKNDLKMDDGRTVASTSRYDSMLHGTS